MKRIAAVFAAAAFAVVARADHHGGEVFATKCVACHGKDGKGTPAGQKMGAKDLTASKLTEADVKAVVENGRGKMTAYKGKLPEGDIAAVSKYVTKLEKGEK